jgi:alpha-amylase/alpha-mannosidase (GH57 family)
MDTQLASLDRDQDPSLQSIAVLDPVPADDPQDAVIPDGQSEAQLDPSRGIFVTVHGHFYQPPRENPYLDAIEQQPSAGPFHDWNERIYWECYRPNAFARIYNDQGEIVRIVNNFEYLSFNIGATLMRWLERYDLEVYQRILEADRLSLARLGYGNAVAQVYNHIIMPLANERDKRTQIRWGKADFRRRFGRDPEGMWLAETAIDRATVAALIDEGITFTILDASQARLIRSIAPNPAAGDWIDVSSGNIDPTRPYRCYLSADRYLDIFFYDGPISRAMGFEDLLHRSVDLCDRLSLAVQQDNRPSQLVSVATDGETFGHHKRGTEKCLAYAFTHEFAERGWQVTNYAHYLATHPPVWEVELKDVTAWSCIHGVDRWQDDCGCGGGGGTQQRWRRPLRDSLNWLRDSLAQIFDSQGPKLLRDPWAARDAYIAVMQDRRYGTIGQFLKAHQHHPLTPDEQIDALRLLEMQQHSLLMFTSCGWFFEELSRPEGTQILRYAARAIELAAEVSGVQLEAIFLKQLATAPTNNRELPNGADVYEALVRTAQLSPEQLAAHYAIAQLIGLGQLAHPAAPIGASLGSVSSTPMGLGPDRGDLDIVRRSESPPQWQHLYAYTLYRIDQQQRSLGPLTLSIGHVRLISDSTLEVFQVVYAALHLGSLDLYCCVQPFSGRRAYSDLKQQLLQSLDQGSGTQVVLEFHRLMQPAKTFTLWDLLPEVRQQVMEQISQTTLQRLDQLYTQVYRDNYGLLLAFRRDDLPIPSELSVAADVALSHRVRQLIRRLGDELSQGWTSPAIQILVEMEAIVSEIQQLGCTVDCDDRLAQLEDMALRSLQLVLQDQLTQATTLEPLMRLLKWCRDLGIELPLERLQESCYHFREVKYGALQTADGPGLQPISPQPFLQPIALQPLYAHLRFWTPTADVMAGAMNGPIGEPIGEPIVAMPITEV